MPNKLKIFFVLDLANNHFVISSMQKIIKEFSKVVKKNNVKAAIKFQLRADTLFIHKSFINSENKYVRRFLDTKCLYLILNSFLIM